MRSSVGCDIIGILPKVVSNGQGAETGVRRGDASNCRAFAEHAAQAAFGNENWQAEGQGESDEEARTTGKAVMTEIKKLNESLLAKWFPISGLVTLDTYLQNPQEFEMLLNHVLSFPSRQELAKNAFHG
jgi:hypothetical protein